MSQYTKTPDPSGSARPANQNHGSRTVQDIQFELMARANFNNLDGAQVAQSLLANRSLWKAAILHHDDLGSLEDIAQDWWFPKMLHISVVPGKEDALENLALQAFHADQVEWLRGRNEPVIVYGELPPRETPRRILMCWWD